MDLLAAEITARTGRDPGEHYRELAEQFGAPYYTRIDAPATPEQKARLAKLSPGDVAASTLAGEPITAKLTVAPGNGAPIGGLKVTARSGWFAARPSGTENIYKIYAESFSGPAHLDAIVREAQEIVNEALRGGDRMKATQKLHDLGQSLWLDNITRDLLERGTLARYIDELSVTGLTSNPTIFEHAIKSSAAYDAAIRAKRAGREARRGALLRARARGPHARRRPVPADPRAHERRRRLGVARGVAAARLRHREHARGGEAAARARRRGRTCSSRSRAREGLPAIEEAIFAGVPINVTLLFSREQYLAAAEAFLRGIERRIDAGLQPEVARSRRSS